MSYQDRHYYRDDDPGGRFRGGAADVGQRIWRALNASFPVGTYVGIQVRVHITFVLLLIFRLIRSNDVVWTLRWAGLLFISVLLHEFGHCLACRRVGGQANDILMWPLGGLAYCSPPHRPWPEFVTVVWGPLVNVILAAASYLTLWFWFRQAMPVSLYPFPMYVFEQLPKGPVADLIADLYAVNYGLLLFNVLLIFYPFDGGRLVQIALWTQMGYVRSMRLATSLGMAGAILTGLVAITLNNSMLLIIAVFGFITCMQQARYVREAGDFDFALDSGYGRQPSTPRQGMWQRWKQSRARQKSQREAAKQHNLDQQIDRILEKVQRDGLASLSAHERSVLQRASDRKP